MIAEIEQALIAYLRVLVPFLGYSLHVDAYAGQLDNPALLAELMRKLPAAYVTYLKDTPGTAQTTRSAHREVTFAVIVATRNPSTEGAARQGSTDRVGSYQIRDDLMAYLGNQTLGLEIDGIKIGAAKAIYNGKLKAGSLSALLFEVKTGCRVKDRADPRDEPPGDFKTAYVEWSGQSQPTSGPIPHPDQSQTTTDVIEVRT